MESQPSKAQGQILTGEGSVGAKAPWRKPGWQIQDEKEAGGAAASAASGVSVGQEGRGQIMKDLVRPGKDVGLYYG